MIRRDKLIVGTIAALLFGLSIFSGTAAAAATYENNAGLVSSTAYPGVYEVKAVPNADGTATIGIPSISKDALLDGPTTESPAIIMGAAAPFERFHWDNGTPVFERTGGGSGEEGIYAPYSKFRHQIMEEKAADGSVHRKLSGYDGSYIIIRVDVSDIIKNAPEGSFLHVKQEGNATLQVEYGTDYPRVYPDVNPGRSHTFSDSLGNKAAVYDLESNAASLKDSSEGKPYVDVAVMSSGTLVAGADAGQEDPTKPTADFGLKFYVDQTADYLPNWSQADAATYLPTDPTAPTLDAIMMAKYYFDQTVVDFLVKNYHDKTGDPIAPTAQFSSYKVMGSDLELEIIQGDDEATGSYVGQDFKYWSLRKALNYAPFNNKAIKLICEVPVLTALVVDGTGQSDRKVIFDVNSFDIQIANHKETDAAALTIKNAELLLKDSSNTTGAELAIGNNARMSIQEGGIFTIDVTCQLEVEYDASSTPATEDPKELNNGIINIENGGKLINNGVLTIEGKEGKAIDPLEPIKRDVKNAILSVKEGGTLTNNGCLLSYGALYCMGTLVNNGKYDVDPIESKDPDKGTFTYHRGIQISWKDDVTQDSIYMGCLYVGEDLTGNRSASALLENKGDIVLVPGILECYGKLNNVSGGNIYVCPVEEAVIPIKATVDEPLIREKRIRFGSPMKSYISIEAGGTMESAGDIRAASAEIVNNGRTGDITPMEPSDRLFRDLVLNNLGTASNSGTIVLDGVSTFGEMTNTGSIETKVTVSANESRDGILYDKAAAKLTNVYNAILTADGSTNIWSHAACEELTAAPVTQECVGGTTPKWILNAKTSASGEGTAYWVNIYQGAEPDPVKSLQIEANKDTAVTGPVLPEVNSNILYDFRILDGTSVVSAAASVTVTSEHVTPPSDIKDLVYNGKTQNLITTGGSASGTALEYRLGTDGEWSGTVPAAKDAGTYTVYYRLKGDTESEGSSDVIIAKRPVVVSGMDLSSGKGTDLKDFSDAYTVSGIVEGEALEGVQVSCDASKESAGIYSITVKVNGENPNYEITVYPGIYTVTEGGLEVTVKDKYGVFIDATATTPYSGYNIELQAAPSDAAVYYSVDKELTDENYETYGLASLPNLPAGAGIHTVYYYVKNGSDAVKGSKRVIIEKAQQKAPENLYAGEASTENSGDGYIEGLEPRAMEYRSLNNDGTYTIAYYEREYVLPGIYLVRRAGDKNHYPSPDFVLTVADGPSITVSYYRSPDDDTLIGKQEGLRAGDLVTRPEDPVREGYTFLGWHDAEGTPFNFNKPLAGGSDSIGLYAHWDNTPPHVHNLKLVEAQEASCTESGNKAYYMCTECSLWFEDATALIEITDRASVIIEALGHSWNSGIITKQATYAEEGIRTYTCTRDSSHTRTESIPKKERRWTSDDSEENSSSGVSSWLEDANGWYYLEKGKPVKNAWRLLPYNGLTYWYYFGETGLMKTGWLDWNGSRYYLFPDPDGWRGRMLTGWQKIDGKWYYFETTDGRNKGHLFRSERTPDGFYVGADGAWDGNPAEAAR